MPVIATAGWSLPKTVANRFPTEGSSLSRYAAVLKGVEINSTFYRSHRPATYEKWAGVVGDDFRFSVKIPKHMTHDQRLKDIAGPFAAFLAEIAGLGHKLGPLLCQLPPSLRFTPDPVADALGAMRDRFDGMLVIEPRHDSWRGDEALDLLQRFRVQRVLADPAVVWHAPDFGGKAAYVRLHGSPQIYYSSYGDEAIAAFHALLGPDSWCVFDNTASGAAIVNALDMAALG